MKVRQDIAGDQFQPFHIFLIHPLQHKAFHASFNPLANLLGNG